jgi:hypothetical protein
MTYQHYNPQALFICSGTVIVVSNEISFLGEGGDLHVENCLFSGTAPVTLVSSSTAVLEERQVWSKVWSKL